jgi:hypothetical protein
MYDYATVPTLRNYDTVPSVVLILRVTVLSVVLILRVTKTKR